ncbi:MAG TPA: histidine kinase, partial [Flavisolibacter sp.]|nr:histidine kinase [Flavisolibacter sp.]
KTPVMLFTSKYFKTTQLQAGYALFSVISFLVFSLMLYGWLKISKEPFSYDTILRGSFIGICLALIYGLSLEINWLNKEHSLDKKISGQLGKERTSAAFSSLTNEFDLHFLFNSLTTLSHLIPTDAGKAHLFNQKLAQVYKYILVNKDRELISLSNEIEFIEDYFFLLQLRHEGKIELDIRLDRNAFYSNMVLPCSLQQLVENAIKHNEFSKKDPLQIRIQLSGSYIKVMNNVQPKTSMPVSTKVGLRNLSNRYILICNKDIIVEEHKNYFIVKLPLINQ